MDSDVLFYYSGSADKVPGSGVNERVSNRGKYKILASIPHWRRMLSNFAIGTFTYEGLQYRTAEHAFQAMKIAMGSKPSAYTFSLNSDSELSRGDGDAARRMRKMIVLTTQQLSDWNRSKGQVMEGILTAKFTQNPSIGRVLLATLDAELWHGTRGTPKSRQYSLEHVREKIRRDPAILAYLLEQNDIDLLDGLITRNNVISVLARTDIRNLSPDVIKWMKDKDLHPEWFLAVITGDDTVQNIPYNLWNMLLANAIVAKNMPLIRNLISVHKNNITSSMVQNMKKLSNGDKDIENLL